MNEKISEIQSIYLSDIIQVLRSKIIFICVVTFVTTAAFGTYAFLAEPVYRVEVLLSPVREDSNQGAMGALSGQLGIFSGFLGGGVFGQGGAAEARAILTSRTLAEEFFKKNQVLPILFFEIWDAEKGDWLLADEEDRPTIGRAFRIFDEKIRFVDTDPDSGLLTLAIEWTDRHIAQQWAESLVEMVNIRQRTNAIREASESIKFLHAELDKTDVVEIKETIFSVMEQQLKTIMLANAKKDYAFKVIDPGVVPDAGSFVRPNRLLIIILGMIGGFLFASFIVVARNIDFHSVES